MKKPTYSTIDLQKIKEDTLGDTSVLKMIIELFVEGIGEFVGVLNEELKNKNWKELFQATHKIKPNISMFGIAELETTILQLESNFRNEQNLDTVDGLVDSCLTILEQVKVELQIELKLMNNE